MTAFNEASSLAIAGFILIGISLILVLFGFFAAKKKKYLSHKWLMISAVITSFLFLVSYISRYIQEGNVSFTGYKWVYRFVYLPVLVIHISLAFVSIYYVSIQINSGLRGQKISNEGKLSLEGDYKLRHKKNGNIGIKVWLSSFSGGIITFYLLYIF